MSDSTQNKGNSSTSNGCPCPRPAREAASFYRAFGFVPIPVHSRTKIPAREGWQDLRPKTEKDLSDLFPAGVDLNIGLLSGTPSRNLADVDLDCTEAIKAAPHLLPPTKWVSGRKSRPRSYYWYIASDGLTEKSEEYHDLDGKCFWSCAARAGTPSSRGPDMSRAR
jgi:hypothetical protein